ncbi:hypothetical protein PQ459_00265 [Chryseobacterium sp. KACC 21268]|nr:hypothetical protein PQ459_00265 [Chryseobacterium sp. KACC 21268]
MWYIFDNSNSIGKKGSEGGIILSDFENSNGARITIEQDGNIASFSVTIGIYNLMFHTYFCSSEQEAISFREETIEKIDNIFNLLKVDNENRNEEWEINLNHKIEEICKN